MRWIEITTKGYNEPEWRSLPMHTHPQRSGDALALVINGRCYLSRRGHPGPGGALGYNVTCMDEASFTAIAQSA
jgi:hypothetical protein